ncbi:MAG: hypothetical protein IH811_11325, partial [Proteobacteria bacterium]|nr:hypothetical protein [Pseudomonadota bacterium]
MRNLCITMLLSVWMAIQLSSAWAVTVCETYRDNFSAVSYSNQDGSMNWSGDWVEVNDNGSPSSGDIRITNANRLRVKDNDRSISRSADLSTYSTATLTFDYREHGFDNAADYVDIEARVGGGAWQLLQRYAGPTVNTGSATLVIDPSLLGIDTEVRLITSSSLGNNDRFRVDNFQIEACSQVPTVDHFNINVGAGAANTCNPFSFTVTAEDSSNNPVTDYTGTVSLTTSTANGNFSAVVATNNVNPNPDTDDNG